MQLAYSTYNSAHHVLPQTEHSTPLPELFVITWADGTEYTFPTQPSTSKRKLGTAKGLIWISEDFDEPLEDFEEYM